MMSRREKLRRQRANKAKKNQSAIRLSIADQLVNEGALDAKLSLRAIDDMVTFFNRL